MLILPNGAANLCLVLGEIDVLENHVFAIAHEVFIIFVAKITAVGLPIVKGRTTIFSVVFQFLVDHLLVSNSN